MRIISDSGRGRIFRERPKEYAIFFRPCPLQASSWLPCEKGLHFHSPDSSGLSYISRFEHHWDNASKFGVLQEQKILAFVLGI
jgi:hypothetical protein